MTISKINTLLSQNPWFRDLTNKGKVNIYNQVYNELNSTKGLTYLNQIIEISDPFIHAYIYNLKSLGLSDMSEVDSKLMDYQFISELSDQQRMVIYNIALEEIASIISNYELQDYFFTTMSPTIAIYEIDHLLLSKTFSFQFIKIIDEMQTLLPQINMTQMIISLLSSNHTLKNEIQMLTALISSINSLHIMISPIHMNFNFDMYSSISEHTLIMPIIFSFTFTPYNLSVEHTLTVPISMSFNIPSDTYYDNKVLSNQISMVFSLLDITNYIESSVIVSPISLTFKLE